MEVPQKRWIICHWKIPGKMVKGMGGAMDYGGLFLLKISIVAMNGNTNRDGEPII